MTLGERAFSLSERGAPARGAAMMWSSDYGHRHAVLRGKVSRKREIIVLPGEYRSRNPDQSIEDFCTTR